MFLWIFVCGILFTLYNAWGGGANDCANSFATAVGAKVLTLKQAVLVASIFEFSGAVLMGSHVTNFVRKKIVSQTIFEDNPGALMLGMLCANLASALWLTLATYLKWPVSTTHSIIGAIIGFSLAYGGAEAIVWDKVGFIVLSWIVSPLLAGIFSFILFKIVVKCVFESSNPFNNTKKIYPLLTFITFFINSLFIIYKGSPQLDLDEMPIWQCLVISLGIGFFTAFVAWYFYLPYAVKKVESYFNENNVTPIETIELERIDSVTRESSESSDIRRTDSYIDSVAISGDHLETPVETDGPSNCNDEPESYSYDNEITIDENIILSKNYTQNLRQRKRTKELENFYTNSFNVDKKADKLCSWLQIFTSCFSSFSHGSNDVANAVAPLASIYAIYETGVVTSNVEVPIWILALGGFGIVVGLATWGYKIIDKMGSEITKISPSRGFIIELAAATTIIIASRSEMPVSTTHCQVGSIVGCGLTSGKRNVKWKLLKGILFSWLVTLPITGLLSAALFSWGFYSPNDLNTINSGNYTNITLTNYTI